MGHLAWWVCEVRFCGWRNYLTAELIDIFVLVDGGFHVLLDFFDGDDGRVVDGAAGGENGVDVEVEEANAGAEIETFIAVVERDLGVGVVQDHFQGKGEVVADGIFDMVKLLDCCSDSTGILCDGGGGKEKQANQRGSANDHMGPLLKHLVPCRVLSRLFDC